VEGAPLDDGADVEAAHVHVPADYLAGQALQVVALRRQGEAAGDAGHAVHGAGALRGQEGTAATGEHARHEACTRASGV
jgi:hypothetical protein